MRNVVVLPAPFGPKNPCTSPRATCRSRPESALVLPNDFTTPRTSTTSSELSSDMVVTLGRNWMYRPTSAMLAGVFLAVNEMKRAKVRFGLLAGAVGLLVFLILFQQALLGGLVNQFIGALKHQSGEVLVYNDQARKNLDGSIIFPDQIEQVAQVEGVAVATPLGEATFTVIAGGQERDAVIFGYVVGNPGEPTTLVDGRLPNGPLGRRRQREGPRRRVRHRRRRAGAARRRDDHGGRHRPRHQLLGFTRAVRRLRHASRRRRRRATPTPPSSSRRPSPST